MDRKQLMDTIINLEWRMFSSVNNLGGRTDCQRDPTTFRIMRGSQLSCWSEELHESYLADLLEATVQGRNLMSEKYARMMEYTFPEEYVALEASLPSVQAEVAKQIEYIVKSHVEWKELLNSRFPCLGDAGRPIRTKDDTMTQTSLETYMRAELKTFSPKTISLYHAATMQRAALGQSEAEEILLNQVREYGHESIEKAEAACITQIG